MQSVSDTAEANVPKDCPTEMQEDNIKIAKQNSLDSGFFIEKLVNSGGIGLTRIVIFRFIKTDSLNYLVLT